MTMMRPEGNEYIMADNAEESLKCPQCGVMYTPHQGGKGPLLECPYCGTKSNIESMRMIDSSNEDY